MVVLPLSARSSRAFIITHPLDLISQEPLLDEAFVHWGVALNDATRDYHCFALCAESIAPARVNDVLRDWYQKAVDVSSAIAM